MDPRKGQMYTLYKGNTEKTELHGRVFRDKKLEHFCMGSRPPDVHSAAVRLSGKGYIYYWGRAFIVYSLSIVGEPFGQTIGAFPPLPPLPAPNPRLLLLFRNGKGGGELGWGAGGQVGLKYKCFSIFTKTWNRNASSNFLLVKISVSYMFAKNIK